MACDALPAGGHQKKALLCGSTATILASRYTVKDSVLEAVWEVRFGLSTQDVLDILRFCLQGHVHGAHVHLGTWQHRDDLFAHKSSGIPHTGEAMADLLGRLGGARFCSVGQWCSGKM